jgi:CubicO group peptidase (beta-lactamase class C family)
MRQRLLRPRTTALLVLAVLCWAGTMGVGQTAPTADQARPNRSPAVAPLTRGSAERQENRSNRQNRLPVRDRIPDATADPNDASAENDDSNKQRPGREEFNPAEERERRESIQAFLDPLIKDLMSELRVPGAAIAIVRRDRVYMMQGYGFGDLTTKARVDAIRTRFPVGRISANITAAAALHAVDRGLIRLESPADAYLAAALPRPLGTSITVEDLLLRETGFAAVSENAGYASVARAPTLDEYLLRTRPAYRRRDTGPSDYEANLLGRILERQSRLRYADHIKQFFFLPIGMNRSGFAFLNADTVARDDGVAAGLRTRAGADVTAPAGWARPYRYDSNKSSGEDHVSGRFARLPARYFAPAPALGLSTTAGDMSRYLVMLLDGGRFGQARLLAEDAVGRMLDIRSEDRFLRPTYYYGLEPLRSEETGLAGRPAAARALVSIGDLPGYSAVLCLAPEKEFGLFLVTNSHAPKFRERVMRGFLDRFVFNK